MSVKITNGRRDNLKTTTPMWCRTITLALQGKRCPTTEELIKKYKGDKRNEASDKRRIERNDG